jgi:hypothetical protein
VQEVLAHDIKNDISSSMPSLFSMWWVVGGLAALWVLDRALLFLEERGWIYYRRRRPVRGVSMYHINELSLMLGGPGEPEIREEVDEDESGDPLGGGE